MNTLITDSRYFAQIELVSNKNIQINWDAGVTKENVTKAILSRLGPNFVNGGGNKDFKPTGHALFDTLSELLPFPSSHLSHFWGRTGPSFASMLDTSGFPLSSQAGYLIWFYARVLGFLGPQDGSSRAVITYDGSPIEFSWQMSRKNNAKPGEFTRKMRFCIEPIDPRDGSHLPVNAVLKYFASPLGSLGVVDCPEEWLEWSIKSHEYLFPDVHHDTLPKGGRFFIGYDLKTDGTCTMKAYFIPRIRPTPEQAPEEKPLPIYCGDTDFRPWLPLFKQLNPVMTESFDMMIDYFESLPEEQRPKFQMMALDIVASSENRIKLYPFGMTGDTWSDAKDLFTLSGRLSSPEMDGHVARLESLWNELFPYATSTHNTDIVHPSKVGLTNAQRYSADPEKDYEQHPQGGLSAYYEFAAGQKQFANKFYVPVRYYGKDDHFTATAVERFARKNGIFGPKEGPETGYGWLPRQIAKAFTHRPLETRSGMGTYVTYGAKPGGWEVTNYFTPELWASD